MSRLPYAAHALMISALAYADNNGLPEPLMGRYAEPDGLDVIRSVRFDLITSLWLTPLLAEIADPRIIGASMLGDGLVVTFHPGTKADTRDSFPLVDAALVLGVHDPAVPETEGVTDLDGPLTLGETP